MMPLRIFILFIADHEEEACRNRRARRRDKDCMSHLGSCSSDRRYLGITPF